MLRMIWIFGSTCELICIVATKICKLQHTLSSLLWDKTIHIQDHHPFSLTLLCREVSNPRNVPFKILFNSKDREIKSRKILIFKNFCSRYFTAIINNTERILVPYFFSPCFPRFNLFNQNITLIVK